MKINFRKRKRVGYFGIFIKFLSNFIYIRNIIKNGYDIKKGEVEFLIDCILVLGNIKLFVFNLVGLCFYYHFEKFEYTYILFIDKIYRFRFKEILYLSVTPLMKKKKTSNLRK